MEMRNGTIIIIILMVIISCENGVNKSINTIAQVKEIKIERRIDHKEISITDHSIIVRLYNDYFSRGRRENVLFSPTYIITYDNRKVFIYQHYFKIDGLTYVVDKNIEDEISKHF